MPHRTATDERLGHLRHRDRGLDTRRHTLFFEGVLQRHGVDHRGEHAHLVTGHAFDAFLASLEPAKNITAANDHADLHAEPRNLAYLRCNVVNRLGTNSASLSAKDFSADLQQDTAVLGFLAADFFGRFLFCRHCGVEFSVALSSARKLGLLCISPTHAASILCCEIVTFPDSARLRMASPV